jgi:GH15 family glucan-1,4-alpha-glucosidase
MPHKYAMGIIGNGSWLALINNFGNVTWLCWPHFDSSFLFGNLLDHNNGGDYKIIPQSEIINTSQRYLEDTNILITTIETNNGTFEINDFAPIFYSSSELIRPHIFIRKITPIKGDNFIKLQCTPTYQYGKQQYHAVVNENRIHYYLNDNSIYIYCSDIQLFNNENSFFALDKPIYLVMTNVKYHWQNLAFEAEDLFNKTQNYWNAWVDNLAIPTIYRHEVIRSALTLHLHVFNSGATIAAATTSLPEF